MKKRTTEVSRQTSDQDRGDQWPETVYRYVEHYKWEPQQLCNGRPASEFLAKIRRQEPPLNFLLNMLCVTLPESWMQAALGSFSVSPKASMPTDLVQRFPIELNECQPDVRLESETHRVFLECKIEAYSDTVQMLKYLLLSAYLDDTDRQKHPWILYLSPGPLSMHWNPVSERKALQTGGTDALRTLLETADLSVLGSGKRARALTDSVEALRTRAVVGHTTWKQFGDALSRCAAIGTPSDLEYPVCRMTNDFLTELERRGLWASNM
jgi:hypothetical protein